MISGCSIINTLMYVNKKEISPIHYFYGNKSLIFIPVVHVGEKSFYNSLKDSVIKWKTDNYIVFYEQLIADKENMSIDSMSYVKAKRKARKIIDLPKFSRMAYKLKADKIFKNKTVQPEYYDIGITESDINADIDLIEMVNEYEKLYGTIKLDSCDYRIPIESWATCKRLKNNMKPIFYTFRNQELARKISESKFDKIAIIYGEAHIKPVIKILKKDLLTN